MSKPLSRTGRSVAFEDPNKIPTRALRDMGYPEEVVELITTVRRVLPVVVDPMVPQIDARKLWEHIGKPHGRFRDWADHYISPLLPSAGISALGIVGSRGGSPRKEYTLSRDIASTLAMQANTDEGDRIRWYFVTMERVVLRLEDRNATRGQRLAALDNSVYHNAFKTLHDSEGLTGHALKHAATELEKTVKSQVAQILTGHRAGDWRDAFGRGIRDVLDVPDLTKYEQCYTMVEGLVTAGVLDEATIQKLVSPKYNCTVSWKKYIDMQEPQRIAA